MSVRLVFAAITAMAVMTGASAAVEPGAVASLSADLSATETGSALRNSEAEAVHTEERTLADLETGMDAFVLSPAQRLQTIQFTLPPNADTIEAWLRLAARPASETTNGRIHVSINGGEAITLRPQPQPMEARFALYSADFRPGENTLSIEFSSEGATAGWIVDARRSQLRLSLVETAQLGSLGALERTLGADFAAPRRIALISEDNRQRATVESLAAQGIALRAGGVPLFTGDAANADLVIRIAQSDALAEADRLALRNGQQAQGPEIAFVSGQTPRLIITGRNSDETTAAARLLAARSFEGYDANFIAADAISANRLGTRQARDAHRLAENADLRTFASSGLPFSADQGARTAVQLIGATESDRFGALSLLARSALVGGEAWLYAWYGDGSTEAPLDHNLLVIGPNSTNHDVVDRSAPAELRAAFRAAERSQGQRGLMRLAAAAYAAPAQSETAAEDDAPADIAQDGVGVASLFMDSQRNSRWIGTFSAPDMASFEAAGRSLARSDLWSAMNGRAAVWSARGVTPIDFSVEAPSLTDRVQEFAIDHTRDAALILFGLAFLMLMRGMWHRRRRVNAS